MEPTKILTINSGSSSIKFSLYDMSSGEHLLLSGKLERIGLPQSKFQVEGQNADQTDLPDFPAALAHLFNWLRANNHFDGIKATGHRIVHGGPHYQQPTVITTEVLDTLRSVIPLAPDHLPQEISAIEAIAKQSPRLTQVACFDTGFHQTRPRVAQLYALPRPLLDEGVLRYGFHGLSYEYLVSELAREGPIPRRLVAAHLGNGASVSAILKGKSIDNTMGLTPTAGFAMSSRSGDLDPGIMLYLLRSKNYKPEDLAMLADKKGGLEVLSGTSSDMRDLLEKSPTDPHAAEAVDLFCYQVKKAIGSYIAVLGGIDMLVFTGGIGENAAPVRERICEGMEYCGIVLDLARNNASQPRISTGTATTPVRVIKANEELMIARHTLNSTR